MFTFLRTLFAKFLACIFGRKTEYERLLGENESALLSFTETESETESETEVESIPSPSRIRYARGESETEVESGIESGIESESESQNNSIIVNSYRDDPIERISAPSPITPLLEF